MPTAHKLLEAGQYCKREQKPNIQWLWANTTQFCGLKCGAGLAQQCWFGESRALDKPSTCWLGLALAGVRNRPSKQVVGMLLGGLQA
ncbi:hypothetical protein ACFX1X_006565 [Malus domestica]